MTPEDKELVERLRYGALCHVSGDGDQDKLEAAAAIERLSAEVDQFTGLLEDAHAELAALRKQIAEAQKQEPVVEFIARRHNPTDTSEFWGFVLTDKFGYLFNIPRNTKLYLHPAADAKDAERYRWLRNEHNVDLPVGRISWKLNSVRKSGEWVNLIDGNDLDAHIDAAMQESK